MITFTMWRMCTIVPSAPGTRVPHVGDLHRRRAQREQLKLRLAAVAVQIYQDLHGPRSYLGGGRHSRVAAQIDELSARARDVISRLGGVGRRARETDRAHATTIACYYEARSHTSANILG